MIRLRIFIFSFLLLIPICLNSQNLDNIGRDFIVCFPENDDYEHIGTKLEFVIINYSNQITNVTIHYLFDDIFENHQILPKSSIKIAPDSKYELKTLNGKERKSIRISSDMNISVICLSRTQSSADGYTALPVNALGKNYMISNVENRHNDNYAQLSVISIIDSTKVSVKTNAKIDNTVYNPQNMNIIL